MAYTSWGLLTVIPLASPTHSIPMDLSFHTLPTAIHEPANHRSHGACLLLFSSPQPGSSSLECFSCPSLHVGS
ncbi:hypothetical protein BJ875DRAFT_476264 [Amylocarpus encephaloides]|uniref:Uncharacterized protein n=1 Tax=Amylocarpus encephaloides TaxID=45428 RepID=A0A9P8C001_9HELO|nr:hypothetical protein BJ875DRAFT_476264 [Amylocarpus encephaloides]